MSQQGDAHGSQEDDWWRQLYGEDAASGGSGAARGRNGAGGPSVDEHFDSALDAVSPPPPPRAETMRLRRPTPPPPPSSWPRPTRDVPPAPRDPEAPPDDDTATVGRPPQLPAQPGERAGDPDDARGPATGAAPVARDTRDAREERTGAWDPWGVREEPPEDSGSRDARDEWPEEPASGAFRDEWPGRPDSAEDRQEPAGWPGIRPGIPEGTPADARTEQGEPRQDEGRRRPWTEGVADRPPAGDEPYAPRQVDEAPHQLWAQSRPDLPPQAEAAPRRAWTDDEQDAPRAGEVPEVPDAPPGEAWDLPRRAGGVPEQSRVEDEQAGGTAWDPWAAPPTFGPPPEPEPVAEPLEAPEPRPWDVWSAPPTFPEPAPAPEHDDPPAARPTAHEPPPAQPWAAWVTPRPRSTPMPPAAPTAPSAAESWGTPHESGASAAAALGRVAEPVTPDAGRPGAETPQPEPETPEAGRAEAESAATEAPSEPAWSGRIPEPAAEPEARPVSEAPHRAENAGPSQAEPVAVAEPEPEPDRELPRGEAAFPGEPVEDEGEPGTTEPGAARGVEAVAPGQEAWHEPEVVFDGEPAEAEGEPQALFVAGAEPEELRQAATSEKPDTGFDVQAEEPRQEARHEPGAALGGEAVEAGREPEAPYVPRPAQELTREPGTTAAVPGPVGGESAAGGDGRATRFVEGKVRWAPELPPGWVPADEGARGATAPEVGDPEVVGGGPPTYGADPTAWPEADPDALDGLVPDTVLDGAQYGRLTLRAAALRGDSARYRGQPRRDALLTARFGSGDDALLLVAMASGARGADQAHRAAQDTVRWIAGAVGRSRSRLAEDLRAARRGSLKSGLHRLTDRCYGRLRSRGEDLGLEEGAYTASLRCLLLPSDPDCRIRLFFGMGEGGLFRIRGGTWQDLDLAPDEASAPFRFRATVAQPGDALLMCSAGLAEPLRGEPQLAAHLAARWGGGTVPGMAAYLSDAQTRVKGYADDRTAVTVWDA